jgi:hypothetical protein
VSRRGDVDGIEVARRAADGTIAVELEDGDVVRTSCDRSGRAVRTIYQGIDGDCAEETYAYDDAGRLVAIEEYPELAFTAPNAVERSNMGGHVEVVHDAAGVVKLVADDGEIVWVRPSRPREEEIADVVDTVAASCSAAIAEAVAGAATVSNPETYGMAVTYSPQGSLSLTLAIGLEADRSDAGGGEEGAISTLYIEGDLSFIEVPIDDRLAATMLREIALVQPEDPYRASAEALARRLAQSDLPGITKTADFVAWAADTDEGLAEKSTSISQCNNPEQVDRWKAGWGREVLPYLGDDEETEHQAT